MVVFDTLKTGSPLVLSKIGAASRFHQSSGTVPGYQVVKLGRQVLLEDMFCGALAGYQHRYEEQV